ncbi:MAG: 2-isopropylmalate synthase [Alphaproteobacteria bacterium]
MTDISKFHPQSAIAKIAQDPERVIIFDTTLRDGEQSPGASMNIAEKLQIARLLADMGVDVIEAGFPIASDGDFQAVREIARQIEGPTICGLARAAKGDIDRAGEAIADAANRRIHTFISTSPLHMEYKLKMTPDQVLEKIDESVRHACTYTPDVEWSAEDGARTEPDFLAQAVEVAIAAGARTINIPDTVGYTTPAEFGAFMARLIEQVPNSAEAIFSVHCHNDLGMAVANSMAGVMAGARQIECTINGIGERAGNAALEEAVMAIRTRNDVLPFGSDHIQTELITRASHLVSTITGFAVQPNKAIVGKNAFAHESGIHQDGMLKHAGTYEIMTPESVGLNKSNLVLGKHSGRHAFREKLKALGYELGDNALEAAFKRFKDLADAKKEVFDEDIIALVDDQIGLEHDRMRFVALEVVAGSNGPQRATLTIEKEGEQRTSEQTGNGPVDAVFNCIKALEPHDTVLELYQVHAVTAGTDAQAVVTVRLAEDGKTVSAQSAHYDTLVASAVAYIHALNKMTDKRSRSNPAEISAQSVARGASGV